MYKRMVLACLASMLLQSTAHGASYVFSAPFNVRSAYVGRAIAVGDFNDDGRDDLVLVVNNALEMSLQRADGTLAPATRIEVPGARAVHSVDLGADGENDLLVGHDGGLTVHTWNGTALVPRDHPADVDCNNIATGDVDSDGTPDVLCLSGHADAMLYFSDSTAVLEAPVYMRTSGSSSGQAQLEDVTGDGKPDLIVAGGANSFFVYRHDGGRGFLPAVAYAYADDETPWSDAIIVTDVDGDGANEVVVPIPANRPEAVLQVFKQSPSGYLVLWKTIPALDIPAGLIDFDIDADGDEDLLVSHGGWDTVGRYMRRGQGLSGVELWSSVSTEGGSRRVAWGDLNHDGNPDIAVANTGGASVIYGGRQVPGDFNADFVSDLVWRDGSGHNMFWYSADGKRIVTIPGQDTTWALQAAGDFDGDGVADLFWRNRTNGANTIWSMGTLALDQTAVASQDWQVVGAGDFDDDEAADLLWRNHRTGGNTIWKSGFSGTQQAVSPTDPGWKVAGVGDFDGDRKSDIVWRHASTGRNVIWRAGRSDATQAMTAVSQPWIVAGIGDFNRDGRDDVVWRHPVTGANTMWLSANAATPVAVTAVPDPSWKIEAVGDYNKDGRADLLWRNATTGANRIWRSADSGQSQAVDSLSGWSVAP